MTAIRSTAKTQEPDKSSEPEVSPKCFSSLSSTEFGFLATELN